MNQHSIERRAFPRFLAKNEYTLILNGKQHLGSIGDISLGGVYLETASPQLTQCNLHQECDILINLNDTIIFTPCLITIVCDENCDQAPNPRVGIEFSTPIKEKTLAVIRECIDHIEKAVA